MSAATFSVQDVVQITGRTSTCVVGRIIAGEIRRGMNAKLSLPDGGSLVARVCGIGAVYGRSHIDNISLLIETPVEDARVRWKAQCQCGVLLTIDT
jgi:hypothetical protein